MKIRLPSGSELFRSFATRYGEATDVTEEIITRARMAESADNPMSMPFGPRWNKSVKGTQALLPPQTGPEGEPLR